MTDHGHKICSGRCVVPSTATTGPGGPTRTTKGTPVTDRDRTLSLLLEAEAVVQATPARARRLRAEARRLMEEADAVKRAEAEGLLDAA